MGVRTISRRCAWRDGVACALRFGDATLASTRSLPSTPPDFILPVHSLFGTWEIVAWDRVVVRTFYDARTLAVAGFLSGLIVVLGVLAYLQQKRLLAQTAQQVTFVNRVSHELRSPLTNILLNLELSQEDAGRAAQASAHRLALVQEEAPAAAAAGRQRAGVFRAGAGEVPLGKSRLRAG